MADADLLTKRLLEIRMNHPGSQPEMVAEVVRAVLATMSGDLSAQETSLLTEVEALVPEAGDICLVTKGELTKSVVRLWLQWRGIMTAWDLKQLSQRWC